MFMKKHKWNLKKLLIPLLGLAVTVPSAVYAASYGISSDGKTNTIIYDRNNTAIQGTYAEPTKDDGSTFLGWSTDKDATTAEYTQSTLNNYLSTVNGGDTKTLYAVWKAPSQLKYAVSVYGIDMDGGHTITFGPAQGDYVKTSKAAHIEKASETDSNRCVHNHT